MKIVTESKCNIVRLSTSTYQRADYLAWEQKILEQIPNVRYCAQEIPEQGDLILISNTQYNFSELTDETLKRVRLIVHPNSGHDNIPHSFVEKASFPIILGNPIRAHAVVEYTLSCLFHHFASPPFNSSWQVGRQWKRNLIHHQNIQIVGHGHIGKLLAKSLRPLCRQLWVCDPYEDLHDFHPEKANVLIMASSLTSDAHEMINQKVLSRLPQDGLIINGARGGLFAQKDLIGFLKENPGATAYLDVFEKEPLTHEFEGINNVFLTSHVAGVYNQLDDAIANYVKQVIQEYMELPAEDFSHKYEKLDLQNFPCSAFY